MLWRLARTLDPRAIWSSSNPSPNASTMPSARAGSLSQVAPLPTWLWKRRETSPPQRGAGSLSQASGYATERGLRRGGSSSTVVSSFPQLPPLPHPPHAPRLPTPRGMASDPPHRGSGDDPTPPLPPRHSPRVSHERVVGTFHGRVEMSDFPLFVMEIVS